MSVDPSRIPASRQGSAPLTPSSEPLVDRRQRTLESVGQVSVNAAPLMAVMEASPDDPEEVAAAIRWCPALTARVLSVINSAAFPGRRPIESVERAVIQLGPSRARTIAMAFGLRLLNEPVNLSPQLSRRLWISSLRKAAAAQLAGELIVPGYANEVYARALIQDLGLPLLMGMDPDFYEHELMPGRRGDWSAQEAARFGLDHGELASWLLAGWNAAESLVEAARDHHQPPRGLEGRDAAAKLPAFLASLLPHLDEELTGTQRDWLTTLHGQFLAETYPSPDAFVDAACHQIEAIVNASTGIDHAALHGALAQAVAGDTIEMVGQLHELEDALGRQREGLDKLRYQAFTDPLTRLLNRRGFMQLASRRVEEAARRGLGACCCVIDLDELKPVNDSLGHDAGDHMLRGLAKLLRRNLDRSDLIGRLGGDEFAILVLNVDHRRAREIVQRLSRLQHKRLRVTEDGEVPLRFSLGAVHVERVDSSIRMEELIAMADEAMYSRKHRGKGGSCFVSYEAATAHKAISEI